MLITLNRGRLLVPPGGAGGLLGLISTGYVPLASQNPYPIIVYSVAKYGLHLSHFWENVIFAISTWSLSVYASYLKSLLTRSSWNEFIDTLVKLKEVKIFPFLNPYLPEFQIPQIPKIFYYFFIYSILLGSTPPSGLASALRVNIVFVVRHIITKELLSKMVKKNQKEL